MRETTYEFIDIDICSDCMMWHANADLSGTPDDCQEAVVAAVGIDEGYDVIPGTDYVGDGHFSKTPCDACRQKYGGNRYPATMMSRYPVKKGN